MRKQSVSVKKLNLKKFEISKLNNPRIIFGGTSNMDVSQSVGGKGAPGTCGTDGGTGSPGDRGGSPGNGGGQGDAP